MANTLFIGKVYKRFDEVGSTNDYALDLLAENNHASPTLSPAKSKPAEGMVVRADRQSAGRGQYGSVWESEAGKNLLLSIILYPTWLKAQEQFYLSMAVALAFKDTTDFFLKLGNSAIEPTIKWPNDLFLGHNKIGGILIQNAIMGNYLQSSVVGIGLNVNQTTFDTTLPYASSLLLKSGQVFDIDRVGDLLFECLEHRYLQLKSGKKEQLKNEYEINLLGLNEVFLFEKIIEKKIFKGLIRGIANDGRLMVEETNGILHLFDLKELRLVL